MKVEIRKPKHADAPTLWKLINDKQVIKQLSGYPFPCPLAKIRREIADSMKEWKTGKSYAFTIFADGEIAGSIVLEFPSKDKKRYDLGFFVGKKFWNKGIATKAIKEAVRFGFNELPLYRIQADCDSDNPASGRALQKAGFRLEGIKKKNQKKPSGFVDLHLWGITK